MTDDELDQRLRASILAEEVDTSRVELAVRKQIRSRRAARWALVAAAAIISLAAFFWPRIPAVCVAAAQDHEREIVKGEPRRWLSDLPAIDSLAAKQGVPASAIAALGTTGYRLERARLCFLKKQIYLHLVYTKDGNEYSVYLRPHNDETSFSKSVRGSNNLAYFKTMRVTAVFVSDASSADAFVFAQAGLHSLTAVAL
jgi:hypothetical protein